MMKKRWTLIAMWAIALYVFANTQEDSIAAQRDQEKVSVREMKDGFYTAFDQPDFRMPPLPFADSIVSSRRVFSRRLLSDCPVLNKKERQSYCAVFVYNWDREAKCLKLCVEKVLPEDGDTAAARRVWDRLRKKYGMLELEWRGDTARIVPAPWVTGRVGYVSQLVPYMSHWVTMHRSYVTLDKGCESSIERDSLLDHTYRMEALRLRPRFDGHWRKDVDYEWMYFTHDVNRDWRQKITAQHAFDEEVYLDLLMEIRPDGRLKAHRLAPEPSPPAVDSLLADLQRVLDGLPEDGFRYLYTADGRIFPGRYVLARYDQRWHDWRFLDYFRSTPKKMKFQLPLSNR